MKERILNIETVHQCNCCLGCKTLHPLVSVIDLSKSNLEQQIIKFDFYTIDDGRGDWWCFIWAQVLWLFQCIIGIPHAGRIYQNKQKQSTSLKRVAAGISSGLDFSNLFGRTYKRLLLLFYNPEEALHLSQREKAKAVECICNIEEELRHAIDCHSQILISRYIELLLDHCNRFYERQFITRCEANKRLWRKQMYCWKIIFYPEN